MITPMQAIADHIQRGVELRERAVVQGLAQIGEMAVNQAKSVPKELGFGDVTGNLRSSMGFNIVKGGKVINESDFKKELPTADEGPRKGQTLAKKIAMQSPKTINLVVVAGMEYAGDVAKRGRDVLDSAEMLAKREISRFATKFKGRI